MLGETEPLTRAWLETSILPAFVVGFAFAVIIGSAMLGVLIPLRLFGLIGRSRRNDPPDMNTAIVRRLEGPQ